MSEVADMLAQLRDLSGRLARFEEVPQTEIDAFHDRKVDVLGRIYHGSTRTEREPLRNPSGQGILPKVVEG